MVNDRDEQQSTAKPRQWRQPYNYYGLRNITAQFHDDSQLELGHKCAMLLLGMHQWINQQTTEVTFTPDGNLTYRIEVRTTLDPTKHILWGNDENADNPYIAVPVCYLDNGYHTNRDLTDGDGRRLVTSSYSETTFITVQALNYCWSQISAPCRKQLQQHIRKWTDTIITIDFTNAKGEFDFSRMQETIWKSITSDNPRKDINKSDQPSIQHWQNERLTELAYMLVDPQVADITLTRDYAKALRTACERKLKKYSAKVKASPATDSNAEQDHANLDGTRTKHTKREENFTILTFAYFLGIADYITSNPELRLPPDKRTHWHYEKTTGNNDAQALLALLLLLSNLCEQYPLIAYVPADEIRQKMIFDVRFDERYANADRGRVLPLYERLGRHLLGPTRLEDHIDLAFQSYVSRSATLEIAPIEHADIEEIKEITSLGKIDEDHKIRARAVAGRIQCTRNIMHREPVSRIRLTVLPDWRTLRYSFHWSLLLALLSMLNIVALFANSPLSKYFSEDNPIAQLSSVLSSLFTGDNLIAGLSMIFTLWLAKTLSGINNSIGDHIRQKLDDTISRELILYSASYAATFLTVEFQGQSDHSKDAPSPITTVLGIGSASIAVIVSALAIAIWVKLIMWRRQWKDLDRTGKDGTSETNPREGTNPFINDGECTIDPLPSSGTASGSSDTPSDTASGTVAETSDVLEKAPFGILTTHEHYDYMLAQEDAFVRSKWTWQPQHIS